MRRINQGRVALAVALGMSVALFGCSGGSQQAEAPVEAQSQDEATTKAAEEEAAKAAAEEAAKAAEEEAAKAAAEDAAEIEKANASAREAAVESGLSVFTGTVRVMSGLDLCEYEGADPNMNGTADTVAESTYVILVLDGSEHVVGMAADGSPRESDADHIGIGQLIPAYLDFMEDSSSRWLDYDGKRVCVAGEPWFQTDVSLPFAPRMFDAQLLYVEE